MEQIRGIHIRGVVIFSPEQVAAKVPTGITTQELYQATLQALGINSRDSSREALEAIGEHIRAFWTDEISESGHILIIPENTIHARKTVPDTTDLQAGTLHRLWLNSI